LGLSKDIDPPLSSSGGNEMTTAIDERISAAAAPVAPRDLTDRDLLDACLRKGNDAWKELMRRYDDSLRGVVYKQLAPIAERLPSDHRDDIMGAFYLKLVDRDMSALRCFDWEKGSALFSWLCFLVAQCATDYVADAFGRGTAEPVEAALDLADEGGVLRSGRKRMRGSLSARVRRQKARNAAAAKKRIAEEQRPSRRRARGKRLLKK
jgi:hypothetical protein